ncbi:4Fe-4S dicluster domain-containing protein, partial [Campylobacter sp. RM12327]
MIEFGYYNKNSEKPVLKDNIKFITDENEEIFISNKNLQNAKIIAKEIDFYLNNSLEDTITKAENVSLLYEARATCFDLSKDIMHSKEIGKNIIIISDNDKSSLKENLEKNDFKVITLRHDEIKFLYGQVGEIYVNIITNNDEYEINCDILLIENAKEYMLKQSGCYEISTLKNSEILNLVKSLSPLTNYRNFITYDEKICQYHERRHEICGKCADICPTVAILKDDEKKQLMFSHIDCIGCGKCVGICPTSAIDFSIMPRNSFNEITNLYKDKIILVVNKNTNFDIKIDLKPNVLPFYVDNIEFLDHVHFMTMLTQSGCNIVLYNDKFSEITIDNINLINQIYEIKFKTKGIYIAQNENELKNALNNANLVPNSYFSYPFLEGNKRADFSKRLEFLIARDDLGVVKTTQKLRYAKIRINEETCTLCLSCVGACNVDALVADTKDNSIKFNPSLCT